MLGPNGWPYTPTSLSDIIDRDTLRVIGAGCCERLGRAMTIIDYAPGVMPRNRIDPINKRQNFERFCHLFREERRVVGGNRACEACDIAMAQRLIRGNDTYREFPCHMGLLDCAQVVNVCGHPVAILLAGQYQPSDGIEEISNRVKAISGDKRSKVRFEDGEVEDELLQAAAALQPKPDDLYRKLSLEADHLENIATAEYRRKKTLLEQKFLDGLRAYDEFREVGSMATLSTATECLLDSIQTFCGCEYLLFFANVRDGETILVPVASAGVDEPIRSDLPHFNWKKAGLEQNRTTTLTAASSTDFDALARGIRGDNSEFFGRASFILPTQLGTSYRGALVFGPCAQAVDFAQESRFLNEVSRVVGWFVLTELQALYLNERRREWENTAHLLTHQLRTTLTPISTQVSTAKILRQRPQTDSLSALIDSSLRGAEALCLRLGQGVKETLDSAALLVEPDDLQLETYPLSVLVGNCAEAYVEEAKNRGRRLIVADNVERMPYADIDIARMTIALTNLLDNALKYSFRDTHILVRARSFVGTKVDVDHVVIEIQDDGHPVRVHDQRKIFEHGERGLTGAKFRRIPGQGLGLWEARSVIEAHKGSIKVSSEPTGSRQRKKDAHRVTFALKIPIRRSTA